VDNLPSTQVDARIRVIDVATLVLNAVNSKCGNIPLRLFGSAAVAVKCPQYTFLWEELGRAEIRDIDLVTLPKYRRCIRRALLDKEFVEDSGNVLTNAQYERLYFYRDDLRPFTIEFFSNPLIFHHKIDVGQQLGIEAETLSLADLVVSKLQWERISSDTAQLIDLSVLFAEHQVAAIGRSDGISADRLLALARRDWCLWRTMRQNLRELSDYVDSRFQNEALRNKVLLNISTLDSLLNPLSNTTLRWKLQQLAHKIKPNLRCGYHVEEPDKDIWNTWGVAT
jgi:hypothetical protein